MEKIRIAVIGSGWVSENRHLPALSGNPVFDIRAIVGRQPDKLNALARNFRIPAYYPGDISRHHQWLSEVEAVMIGTDPLSHYYVAKYCLNQNLHILMEKPLTDDLHKSAELVTLSKKKKKKFAVVHNFQFSASSAALDRDLKLNKLGSMRGLAGLQFGNPRRRLPIWYEKLPWGLFFDESPHLLYLMNKYSGGLKLLSSVKYESPQGNQTPLQVNCQFQTQNHQPVSLFMNFESAVSEWFLVYIGSEGLGIIDIFRDIYTYLPNDHGHTAGDILKTFLVGVESGLVGTIKSGTKVLSGKYLCGNETVVDKFADAVLKNRSLTPIDIADAYAINKLQFEIIRSAAVIKSGR